ncbi:MAG: DapH/DapD/GlmU-related protein [Methanobacteriota archaeon]
MINLRDYVFDVLWDCAFILRQFIRNHVEPESYFIIFLQNFRFFRRILLTAKLGSVDNTNFIRNPIFFRHGENIHLGKNVYINSGTHVVAGPKSTITMEDNVTLGPRCMILATQHDYRDPLLSVWNQKSIQQDVLIKENAWLGGHVIVLPGVTIGKNAVIGAGSVVTKDIPDFTVSGGVPAKVIKKI